MLAVHRCSRLLGFAYDLQWHGWLSGLSTGLFTDSATSLSIGAAILVVMITVFWMIQEKQSFSS